MLVWVVTGREILRPKGVVSILSKQWIWLLMSWITLSKSHRFGYFSGESSLNSTKSLGEQNCVLGGFSHLLSSILLGCS